MDKFLFAGIAQKAQEIEDLFRGKDLHARMEDTANRMRTEYHLVSLSSLARQSADFEPILKRTLDPPTSGYSSDCYENDGTEERIHSLSFTEVKNLLLDCSVIEILSGPPPNGEDYVE